MIVRNSHNLNELRLADESRPQRLGRRGPGVRIASPRPIESMKYGQLRLAVKSTVVDFVAVDSRSVLTLSTRDG